MKQRTSRAAAATPEATALVNGANMMPDLTANKQGGLVPHYINTVGDAAPWLVGLLAVCALAVRARAPSVARPIIR